MGISYFLFCFRTKNKCAAKKESKTSNTSKKSNASNNKQNRVLNPTIVKPILTPNKIG